MQNFIKLLSVLIVLACSFTITGCDRSAMQAEAFKMISTEALAKGIEQKSLQIFDNNTPGTYRNGHIPTAVYMDPGDPDPKLLPDDQGTSLAFYCKNERCMASHQGAKFALGQGYTDVSVYPKGIDGWIAAGQSVEKAKK